MAEKTKDIQKKEGQPERVERTRARRIYAPDVDILEKKDKFVVTADMPGVDEASVDVTLEKSILTIYGRVDEEIPQKHTPAYIEYGIGDYQRVFTLPDEIDRDGIEATVKNGILSVVLPKARAAQTKKITVRAEA